MSTIRTIACVLTVIIISLDLLFGLAAVACALTVLIVSAGLLYGLTELFPRLFPGKSGSDFANNDAYWADFMIRQRRCRELHILSAGVVGLVAGLIICLFNWSAPGPLLIVFATLETTWLLLVYVVLRPKTQSYMEWPQLGLAVLTATIVAASLGASAAPLLVFAALAFVAFAALMPM